MIFRLHPAAELFGGKDVRIDFAPNGFRGGGEALANRKKSSPAISGFNVPELNPLGKLIGGRDFLSVL